MSVRGLILNADALRSLIERVEVGGYISSLSFTHALGNHIGHSAWNSYRTSGRDGVARLEDRLRERGWTGSIDMPARGGTHWAVQWWDPSRSPWNNEADPTLEIEAEGETPARLLGVLKGLLIDLEL